jgi:hypothetical protein
MLHMAVYNFRIAIQIATKGTASMDVDRYTSSSRPNYQLAQYILLLHRYVYVPCIAHVNINPCIQTHAVVRYFIFGGNFEALRTVTHIVFSRYDLCFRDRDVHIIYIY